jgi:hypothetical protein
MERATHQGEEHMTLERALEILKTGLITQQEQLEIAQMIKEYDEEIRTLQSQTESREG